MANFNFNKVILGGRLTADPELKTTQTGTPVTKFTIAINRRFGGKNGEESQSDFFTVIAWRQTAEFITRYFRKASSICVTGSLQTRSWVDQNGQKRYATEIVADEACFVDAKGESPSVTQPAPAYQPTPAQQPSQAPSYAPDGYGYSGVPQQGAAYNFTSAPKFEDLADDDELPF